MARSTSLERTLVNDQLTTGGSYDNTVSGLTADNVKAALDEIDGRVDIIEVDNALQYVEINSSGALPTATGADSVTIGQNASAGLGEGISIGLNSSSLSLGAVALGGGASSVSVAVGRNSNSGGAGAVAVGLSATAPRLGAIALGLNAVTGASADEAIAIGRDSTANNIRAIAVGYNADASGEGVSLGANSISALSGVALGRLSEATGSASLAIGQNSNATASGSYQLGTGTNATADTLQFLTTRLANAEGLYTSHVGTNYSPADADNVTSHFAAIDTEIGSLQTALIGGVTYVGGYNATYDFPALDGQTVTLAGTAALDDTVNVVGTGTSFLTQVASGDSITIASETRIVDTVTDDTNLTVTVAFTAGTVSAQTIAKDGALVSISQGDMYTVTGNGDFFTETVTIGDVLIAEVDSGTTLTDWTLVENNLEDAADVAYANGTSGLTATNVQTAIDEVESRVDTLESTAPTQASTVNRETITANKTLVNADEIYQHIKSDTASLLVDLPASPVNGTHFIVKNNATSSESFTTNSVVLSPGNIYEVIYDGTEWVVL